MFFRPKKINIQNYNTYLTGNPFCVSLNSIFNLETIIDDLKKNILVQFVWSPNREYLDGMDQVYLRLAPAEIHHFIHAAEANKMDDLPVVAVAVSFGQNQNLQTFQQKFLLSLGININ